MVNEQVDGTALGRLRRIFTNDTPLALIAADVDRVQSYVFESAKLAEMRGASLILDLLNVKDRDDNDVWGDVTVEKQSVIGIEQMLQADFREKAVLIYASGGGAMIVSELAEAGKIKDRIEKLYVETTLTATITVVYEPVRLADLESAPAATDWIKAKMETARGEALRLLKDNLPTDAESERGRFSELYASLSYQLRRAKQRKLTAPIFEVSSFSERCGYCHFRPACQMAPEVEERPICQVCIRKRQDKRQSDGDRAAQSFYLHRFKEYLDQENARGKALAYGQKWVDAEAPPELEAIAKAGDKRANNFVGIIYADGNDMGAQLERLKNVNDLESFANQVRTTMKHVVFSGLGALLAGPRPGEREYRDRNGHKRTRPIKHHSFEIITIGGDDVYLFVPADVALELAHHICHDFAQRNQDRKLTLAAGVLITDVNTPIYFSRQIVKGLLKNAKKLSKAEDGKPAISAVDFQVITTDTAITEDIAGFRKKAYRTSQDKKVADGLTTRPLTLGQLKELIGRVRCLKDSSFPKSQLYALREAVVRGPRLRATNFYYYQQARNDQMKKQYAPLHAFLNSRSGGKEWATLPFWKSDRDWLETNYITPIVDILEIYDFVRKTSGDKKEEQA